MLNKKLLKIIKNNDKNTCKVILMHILLHQQQQHNQQQQHKFTITFKYNHHANTKTSKSEKSMGA
jgi:hypothetical protein